MSRRNGQLKLGAFLLSTGHHVAAWRHPESVKHVERRDGSYFVAPGPAILAHLAERHGFPRIHP